MYHGFMLEEYLEHNLFVKGLKNFMDSDPHLQALKSLKFVHPLDWWKQLDLGEPGIYMLTGGRQIGKSTSTKLLIQHTLEKKLFHPHQIFYLPCDEIDDYHYLSKIISLFIDELPTPGEKFLVIIDEVTFIPDWDKAIKALADEGLFRRGVCLITGSDSVVLKEAANRFPGRRGQADKTDFHLQPLNFCEYAKLVGPEKIKNPDRNVEEIFNLFDSFMKCGGYLRAINELHARGEIKKATYLTFEQWIRGDFEKRGKNVGVLKGVLKMIYSTTGSQVTYSSLTNSLGEIVKETFIDYVSLLERMDIIFSLQAFDQNRLLGFPKKARKIHFFDPFIMDAIGRWLEEEREVAPRETAPIKAESITASNYARTSPVYYIKAEGEIDLVVLAGKKIFPIEVKWAANLRNQDMKQLAKYKHSIILTKNITEGTIENIPCYPLPLYLINNSTIKEGSPV